MTFTFKSAKYFCVALLFLFAALPVRAQDALTYSVSPTIFDMTANPGQSWQSTVRVINPNSYDLTLYIDVAEFIPKEEDGIPQFIPLENTLEENNSFPRWISVQREITIAPEQTAEIPLLITVPTDAPPGGHYAALMIGTRPPEAVEQQSAVQTSQVISSLLFLRVTGSIAENASIRSFRTTDYFLGKPSATFDLRIQNKGNVHIQPQGEIKIYNMWGQERGVIPVNQQTMLGNVLPNSVRKFSFKWDSEWSLGDIGRYTAEVTLAYGLDERQFINATTAFWIIPWKIILSLIVVIAGIIAFLSWVLRLYVRHVLKLAGVSPDVQPEQKGAKRTTAVKKHIKAADVRAPFEAGILDLRSRLSGSEKTLRSYLSTAYTFAKAYWKFFAAIAALLVLLVLLGVFIVGGRTPTQPYTISDPVSGETISEGGVPAVATPTNANGLAITLINRTESPQLLDDVTRVLDSVGFKISATSTESGTPEEKTVIVYNPEAEQEALLLSQTLNNALLSAYTASGSSTDAITVYIGSDAILRE
jgi:hypothetical protein